MSELKNKQSRACHKGYLKQALEEVDDYLENNSAERKPALVKWRETLQELEKIAALSDAILALMEADDSLRDEDFSAELRENNKIKFEVKKRLAAINELLAHAQKRHVLYPTQVPQQ